MTETVTIHPSAVTVTSGRPTYAFGQQAKAPVESGVAVILSRSAFSPEIPTAATVTTATLTYRQVGAISGSVTMSVQPNAAKFDSRTTWNTRPAATGTLVSLTKSSPADGTAWVFDVTAHVQDFISGAMPNFGWKVTTTSGTRRYLKGAVAATGKPELVFSYEATPPPPQNLVPNGGAVSTNKPILAWDDVPGILTARVQIDPAANFVTPAFDSGEVSVTSSILNLALTAYAGLSSGSSTSWRVQVRTPGGLSGWSDTATFSRTAKVTPVITNPGSTSADGSPPLVATFAGTVKQWRVTLRDTLTQKILVQSKWASDPTIAWTPPTGLTIDGQQGTFTLEVVDDVTRVATPGDPVASIATQTFTLALSATVAGMDSLVAEQRGVSPVVFLKGSRAAGIPDEVAVFADGQQIARMPGTDVFTGTNFEIPIYSLPMGYRVSLVAKPVVNNQISDDERAVSIVPKCLGLWLVAEDDGSALGLLGTENDAPEGADLAVVHQPVTGDAAAVRRRLSRPPKSGSQSGDVLDWHMRGVHGDPITADEMLAIVDLFAASDQGRLYRLVVGHLNLRVIAGDFNSWPDPLSNADERIAVASFSWWGQREDAAPTA